MQVQDAGAEMEFIADVFDVLGALVTERGLLDPTLRRMVSTYREVADLLGYRAEFELMLGGVLDAAPCREADEGGDIAKVPVPLCCLLDSARTVR